MIFMEAPFGVYISVFGPLEADVVEDQDAVGAGLSDAGGGVDDGYTIVLTTKINGGEAEGLTFFHFGPDLVDHGMGDTHLSGQVVG